MVVDDLGWHNVQWHNPDMITPNANKLVADGMTCDPPLISSMVLYVYGLYTAQRTTAVYNCDAVQAKPLISILVLCADALIYHDRASAISRQVR